MAQAKQQTSESNIHWFELSVESDDGKESVLIKLFDNTVDLARQVESIFETIARHDHYKKYTTVKIKRK